MNDTTERSIYRESALQRFTSPEPLDALLAIVAPRLRPPPIHLQPGERLRALRQRQKARVKTPTVLQMEAAECGAASLGIVLGYHGRYVPLEELRVRCGVSRDGSKASNIVRAARSYGLLAKGYKKEPGELADLGLPVIVFWNFTHFLVVEGFGPGCVYVNDPATGPRTVSAQEFDEAYTGVALAFAPGPDFEPAGSRQTVTGALRRRLRGFEAPLLIALALGVLLVGPGLAVPILTRDFVDHVLVGRHMSWIGPVLLALAVVALLRGALAGLQGLTLLRMETSLSRVNSRRFFEHVLRLPVEFYAQRYAGDIGARVAINDRLARLLTGELAISALGALFVVFYAVLMAGYNLILAAISILVALFNVAVLRVIARQRVDANRRLEQDRGKLVGTGYAALQMIETVKASGAEGDFFARWAGFQARVVNADQALALPTAVLTAAPVLLSGLNMAVILVLGADLVMNGQMTAGTLVAFAALLVGFLQPINQLVALGGSVQEVEADMNRLDDVLSYPTDPQLDGGGRPAAGGGDTLRGAVELRGLTFGYSRVEPPLIQDFDLTVQPSRWVALVGGSGSGKSTVARLICGLYEPWSGEILLDGRPRHEVPRGAITRSLALVDQDIHLFAGTIRDNITLWDDTIPMEDIIRAARDAEIHDEIMARPGGYESCLEERGRDLSGGQRQRLEIARALVGNPSILVLDEATSALDPVTEKAIVDNLRRRGCTCVIVAHRLSTIRDADEILLLHEGRVVQRGTHEAMRDVPGPYHRLIEAGGPGEAPATGRPETNGATPPRAETEPAHGAPAHGHDETLLEACRLVGNALGVTVRTAPFPAADELGAIARASRMRTRQVVLREGWWQSENGPLLAFREADSRAVALLPAGRGRYTLADPAAGTRTPVTKEVAASLLPYAVMFYRPLPERRITARDLIRFGAVGGRRDLLTILVMGIVAGLLALATPLATGVIFNSVIPHARRGELVVVALVLTVSAFAVAAFGMVQRIALLRAQSRADAGIQAAVWDRLLSLPSSFFREYEAGDLGDRAMGIATIHQILGEAVSVSILAAVFSVFSLGLLFFYDAGMALLTLGLAGLFATVSALTARWELRHRRTQSNLEGRLSGLVLQIIMGIGRFRVAGAENRAFERWAASFEEKTSAGYRAGLPRLTMSAVGSFFPVLTTLILFAVVSRGGTIHMQVGSFLAFSAAFAQFLASGIALNTALIALVEMVPIYERAVPILQTAPEVDESGVHPGELRGEIRLDGVSFRYETDGPLILDDVSVEIKPGECVAIVGPSGSGKSTLLRLLLGFERPEAGQVLYDGRDLATLDVREVRRQVGVVLQNGSVMPGFILDNILGAARLTVDDAWEAARKAGLDEDIRQMPMGMYTLVSEGGTTFSGGQRQRLLIARALVGGPRLVYLDEATSALDNTTQAHVAESVAGLRVTRVLIAHRLSTILQADRVIVMSGGKVRQVGTYDELIHTEGLFKRLAERQMA